MLSRNRLGAKGGFSLVEVLVVLAILAILIGILIPVVGGMGKKAQKARCASNMKELGQLVLLYSQENDGRFPGLSNPYWDIAALRMEDESANPPTYRNILHCPSDGFERSPGLEPRSYAMNPVLMNYFDQFRSWGATSERNEGMRLMNLVNPAKTFLLIEHHHELNAYPGGNWIVATGSKDIHDGGMNTVFCDGHVEFIPLMPTDEFQQRYQVNR